MVKKLGILIAAVALSACTSTPLTPAFKPTAGTWSFSYELNATDSAAIDRYLVKFARLEWDPSGLIEFKSTKGDTLGTAIVSRDKYDVSMFDCGVSFGACGQMTMTSVSAEEMVGTMDYYDRGRSLKVGPAKVTARFLSAESPSPSPSSAP